MTVRQAVSGWVRQHTRYHFWLAFLGSFGLLICAVWLTCMLWAMFQALPRFRLLRDILTTQGSIIGFWIVLGLLFIAYFLIDPHWLNRLEMDRRADTGRGSRALSPLSSPYRRDRMGFKSKMSLLKVFLRCLLVIPELFHQSVTLMSRSWKLTQIQSNDVGRALLLMLRTGHKVSLTAAHEATREISLKALVSQLKLIEGVTFLQGEPPEICLTETLQNELVAAVEKARQASP